MRISMLLLLLSLSSFFCFFLLLFVVVVVVAVVVVVVVVVLLPSLSLLLPLTCFLASPRPLRVEEPFFLAKVSICDTAGLPLRLGQNDLHLRMCSLAFPPFLAPLWSHYYFRT